MGALSPQNLIENNRDLTRGFCTYKKDISSASDVLKHGMDHSLPVLSSMLTDISEIWHRERDCGAKQPSQILKSNKSFLSLFR